MRAVILLVATCVWYEVRRICKYPYSSLDNLLIPPFCFKDVGSLANKFCYFRFYDVGTDIPSLLQHMRQIAYGK